MKVYVFSSPTFREFAASLINTKWLGDYDGWEWNDLNAISGCSTGLGYDPKKILAVCPPEPQKVILVEANLLHLAPQWQSEDKNSIVFSVSGYLSTEDKVSLLIKQIEVFTTLGIVCIDPQCPCNGYLGIGLDICDNCQTEMVRLNLADNAIRLLAVSALDKEKGKLNSYYKKHIGYAIQDVGIAARHPSVIVKSSKMIIDAMAASGTPVRNWLGRISTEMAAEKTHIRERYKTNWTRSSKMPPILIASRRWNSWTPNQPNKEESKVLHYKTGGGYFFSDGQTNIAIDPGYGYLDMLYGHGLTVMDLDCVIVTHDHPDHLAEFQNILGLRQIYKSQCPEMEILLNPSSYYLLSNYSKYYYPLLKGMGAQIIYPDKRYKVGNIDIKTIGMYHDEIFDYVTDGTIKQSICNEIGTSKALGLSFSCDSYDGFPFRFVIPGDSSFPSYDTEWQRLAEFFGNADIAAIHLGSLEEGWNDSARLASSIRYRDNGHLGLNGAIQLISLINPKLAILTEFGEELDAKDVRMSIVEIIRQSLSASITKILPSDVSLFLVMHKGEILCQCKCKKYVPATFINSACNELKNIEYDFTAGCESELCHIKAEDIFPLATNLSYDI